MDEFQANFKASLKHFSTYVAFIASGFAAWWLQQDLATQQAIIDAIPYGKLVAPSFSFGVFMLAKAWPQKTE